MKLTDKEIILKIAKFIEAECSHNNSELENMNKFTTKIDLANIEGRMFILKKLSKILHFEIIEKE